MANTIANSMKPMCPTKAFYKGKEIDLNDLTIVWSDHWGNPMSGDINDFASSRSDDAISENEAGESW